MYNRIVKLIIPDSELELEGLRVNFKVTKSLVGYPNLANIKVYNMSESSRNKIEETGLRVELYAGHEDTGAPLLFKGDIINVIHLKQGTDWVSEVYAGDGKNILETSVINTTLSAGATPEAIYNTLISNMQGVTKGITEGLKDCLSGKRSLLRTIQLSGNVKDFLDQLAKDCGFDYSVNDGVIETFPHNLPVSDEAPVIINQGTGMIGSPERTDIGINVKNLLLPALKLGRTIKVEALSERLNVGNLFFRKIPPVRNQGVYRIDKLIHTGDDRDNLWETNINARVF